MPGIRPRLIHPVQVTIEPLVRATTKRDRRAREPVPQQRRSAAVTIPAQVHWGQEGRQNLEAQGPVDKYDGWLAFRQIDLTTAGYTPKPGDRVTAIETQAKDLYLTGNAQDRGQYGQAHWLVKVFFEDRGVRRE